MPSTNLHIRCLPRAAHRLSLTSVHSTRETRDGDHDEYALNLIGLGVSGWGVGFGLGVAGGFGCG